LQQTNNKEEANVRDNIASENEYSDNNPLL